MVGDREREVFSALLCPVRSRGQSHPPEAPAAPSAAAAGTQEFLKNTEAALAPRAAEARTCTSYQKHLQNTELMVPNGRGSRAMNRAL